MASYSASYAADSHARCEHGAAGTYLPSIVALGLSNSLAKIIPISGDFKAGSVMAIVNPHWFTDCAVENLVHLDCVNSI